MDAVLDPGINSVVLMWSSQTAGKTEVLNNIVGFHISERPSPMLIVQPTLDMGKSWSKDRLVPMIRDTPRLHGLVADPKSRSANNTTLHKNFPGGHLTVVGANAPSGLASRPIRVLVCDEVDRYPESAGTEGDPISIANKRTETFHDSIRCYTSTPTIKGLSRIEAEFELSDKRKWFCPCPACGKHQTLEWKSLRWPPGKPEEAAYHCEFCDAAWDDKARCTAIRAGEWRATAEFKGKRGYFLNGLYNLFPKHKGYRSRHHQFATDFLDAKHKGDESLHSWINTFLCETYERKDVDLDIVSAPERGEKYGPEIPAGVLVLVAAVDVQKDYLQAEIVGWGENDETWGIETRRFAGITDEAKPWAELDEWLLTQRKHVSGRMLRPACVCVDSGARTKTVYDWCRARNVRRVYAVKGSHMAGAPLVSYGRKQALRGRRPKVIMVGTDTAKEHIYCRLMVAEPGPRYMHYPIGYGYDEEYFQQLTAETAETRKSRGFRIRQWVKKRERNEALDIRVYCMAAVDILDPDWKALSKNIAAANPGQTLTKDETRQAQVQHPLVRPGLPYRPRRKWTIR